MSQVSQALPLTCAELSRRTGAELVTENPSVNQIRLTFRVPRGQGATKWLVLMKQLLRFRRQNTWTIDISKHYFLVDTKGEDMRFGWRVIFQGENMAQYDKAISTCFTNIKTPPAQLAEVPLHGNPNRSPTAGEWGKIPLGKAAVR